MTTATPHATVAPSSTASSRARSPMAAPELVAAGLAFAVYPALRPAGQPVRPALRGTVQTAIAGRRSRVYRLGERLLKPPAGQPRRPVAHVA